MSSLNSIPDSHTRAEIEALVASLTEACARHGGSQADRVRAFQTSHAELLNSYPMLYRSICKGTLRSEVLRNLLDARDRLHAGHDTEAVQKELVDKAIAEVKNFSNTS